MFPRAFGLFSFARRAYKGMANVIGVFACALLLVAATSQAADKSNDAKDKIIISGASGQLGELVVKELLKRGVPAKNLILVSRTPDKLQEYAKQGASVRFGDVDQPESLPSAYAGGTKMLFISLGAGPGSPPRPPRHKIGFDAAVKAGVKYIVYTSFLNADTSSSPLALDHRQSEEYLKASGAKWTSLRNGFYADMMLQQAAKMLADGKVTVDPNEPKSAPVTREDCAAAAAGALTTPGHENKAYEITGPDLVNRKDIAQLVSQVTGKKIEIVEQAGASAEQGMGMPVSNEKPTLTKAVQELSGRPATTMRAFLEANKDKLLQAPKK